MPPKLIITRPRHQSDRFAEAVMRRLAGPVDVIVAPSLRIVPLDAPLPFRPESLIFTSSNGVAQAGRLGLPEGLSAWCVGQRTTQAAVEAGFAAEMAGLNAVQLRETVLEAKPKGPILHIAGTHTRGDIVEYLQAAGHAAQRITAYDQQVERPTKAILAAAQGADPLILPLFSARSALILQGIDFRAALHFVAISAQVATELDGMDADTITVALKPDEESMIDATVACIERRQDRPLT